MTHEDLKDVLVEHIRDLYDAEKQLVKALPKLAKAAESEELSEAITTHLEETKGQVTRLEKVFGLLDVTAKGKTCKGMKGLIEEGNEVAAEEEGVMRDLAIIAAAQKVEHYEISAYGTARTLAEKLGIDQAAELLQQTEEEEAQADENLTNVAMSLYDSAEEEGEEETEAVGGRQSSAAGTRAAAGGRTGSGGNRGGSKASR